MTAGAEWLDAALGLTPGSSAFPWQTALLERFRAGDVPRALDLPTGLGKTSVIAIWLVAPTTPEDRVARIVKRGSGFIYYVSREGVTGMQAKVNDTIGGMVAKIRAHTSLPVAVGFGVSNPEQARAVALTADAAVVGSAIVDRIAKDGASPDLVKNVGGFVRSLAEAVHAG